MACRASPRTANNVSSMRFHYLALASAVHVDDDLRFAPYHFATPPADARPDEQAYLAEPDKSTRHFRDISASCAPRIFSRWISCEAEPADATMSRIIDRHNSTLATVLRPQFRTSAAPLRGTAPDHPGCHLHRAVQVAFWRFATLTTLRPGPERNPGLAFGPRCPFAIPTLAKPRNPGPQHTPLRCVRRDPAGWRNPWAAHDRHVS
jgi:hypothetical protein